MQAIVTLFALAGGGAAAAPCPATIPGAPTGNAAEREGRPPRQHRAVADRDCLGCTRRRHRRAPASASTISEPFRAGSGLHRCEAGGISAGSRPG